MKEYKKPPVKYHYKLADNAVDQRQWDGGRGKVMSVLRKTHWMTARDVANQLRIEPHVAQGLLQRLLAKGAVERRVIPGSVHDVPVTPQRERAGLFFVGDKVSFNDGSEDVFLIGKRINKNGQNGFQVFSLKEGYDFVAVHLGVPGKYKLVESGDAASTPKSETKPDWNCFGAEPEKFPFAVGMRFGFRTGLEYDVLSIDETGQRALICNVDGTIFRETAASVKGAKLVGPSPMRFHVARPELLPNDALSEVSKVFGIGADKYARDDWAKKNNGGGDHVEAALRHIDKHKNGQRLELGETGSGLPHLYHAAARLLMAIGKELRLKCQ